MPADGEQLKPCPACRKVAGELKKSELPSRFPYYAKCTPCGYTREFVKLPGIAAKLWNEAKKPAKRSG